MNLKIIARNITVLIMAIAFMAGTVGCEDKDILPQTEEPVVSEEETEIDSFDEYEDEIEETPEENPAPEPDYDENGIDFTTTDFEGNTITGRELFSQHEFTMVNVWATWCGYCLRELNDLESIDQAYAGRDCAIVGLCGDASDENTLNNAKEILASNGVTYTNIRPFDGWDTIFEIYGWPTSFFVNRQGVIVSEPISGARLQSYVYHFDSLLADKEASPVQESQESGSSENSEGMYRIRVIGNDQQPVEGATIQFCSDETCRMGVTGSDGTVTFEDPPGVYEVHVLKVPDGYNEDTSLYRTDDHYGDMVITLDRS